MHGPAQMEADAEQWRRAYLQRLYMPQRATLTKLLWAHFVLINTLVHGGSPQIQQIEPGTHCQQP
jgi:hypothetical protein